MKREKSVLIGIVCGVSIVLLIGFVSANWFSDLFKIGNDNGGEGELPTAHSKNVQLQVQGLPDPPEIVYISDINYKDTGVLSGERDLTEDTTTKKDFEFYAWSNAGVSALPTGAAVTSSTALLTLVDIVNLPNNKRRSSDAAPAAVCVHNRDAVCLGSHTSDSCRVYRCSVAMQYYDDYGSVSSQNWRVYAYIKDNFNQEEGFKADGTTLVQNAIPLPTRLTYFNPVQGSKLVPDTGNMDFGTVGYGPQTTQPADATGTYPLRIRNTGNKDITPIQLQSSNIPGVTDNSKLILSSWFKTSESSSNPCTGTALVAGSMVNTGMAQINNGAGSYGDLRVCLTQVEASATVQAYSTTATGGAAWIVDTTFV